MWSSAGSCRHQDDAATNWVIFLVYMCRYASVDGVGEVVKSAATQLNFAGSLIGRAYFALLSCFVWQDKKKSKTTKTKELSSVPSPSCTCHWTAVNHYFRCHLDWLRSPIVLMSMECCLGCAHSPLCLTLWLFLEVTDLGLTVVWGVNINLEIFLGCNQNLSQQIMF